MWQKKRMIVAAGILAAVLGAGGTWLMSGSAEPELAQSSVGVSDASFVWETDAPWGDPAPSVAIEEEEPSFVPAVDRSAEVAAVFSRLEQERDALVGFWSVRLADLRDEDRVADFVDGVTSFSMKGEVVYDLVTGESHTDHVWTLLRETIVDERALFAELRGDVEEFQNNVQFACGELLRTGGSPDDQIVAVLQPLVVESFDVPTGPFYDLVNEAVSAGQDDGVRFVANWVASDLLTSAAMDVGDYLGSFPKNQSPAFKTTVGIGTDLAIGDALDRATDFSDSIKANVERHLLDAESGWTAALTRTLDTMLVDYRRGCESALSPQ